MKKALLLGVCCLTLTCPAIADEHSEMEKAASEAVRVLPDWSYEKLVAEADIVAIVEPVENTPAKDTFPGKTYGQPVRDFVATNTRFRVQAVLKTKRDAPKELSVLHFAYSENVRTWKSAAFVNFLIGPLSYEKRVVKPGPNPWSDVVLGPVTTFSGLKPTWLAFLKRRQDGRFEPVSGQFDSAFSFRELHRASFYSVP